MLHVAHFNATCTLSVTPYQSSTAKRSAVLMSVKTAAAVGGKVMFAALVVGNGSSPGVGGAAHSTSEHITGTLTSKRHACHVGFAPQAVSNRPSTCMSMLSTFDSAVVRQQLLVRTGALYGM